MLPEFEDDGNLPPVIHWAAWDDVAARFGGTPWRCRLLSGLRAALEGLRRAGCQTAYLDGSFVSDKSTPNDYDVCWEEAGVDLYALDPALLIFDRERATQKAKFGGEFFPASALANPEGDVFLDFFRIDKETGEPKGIVALDLGGLT